jgi:CRISPR-associated protein Csm5
MRVRMNVAAPLRVGGREQQVNKLEFVRHGGKVHAVSPRKLAQVLLEHSERTLSDWSTEVLRKGQGADLTRFLGGKGLLDTRALGGISRYSVPDAAGVRNEFIPHARDARGRLFIPGTAIKGAIRAAVMWALVDEDEANSYVRNNRSSRARFYANNLDHRTLQSYELPRRKLRAGPHHDLLRAVKVADAYGELESRVEKVLIQSYKEDGRGRTASVGASDTIYVECLVPGSWAEFDLKVDRKILDDFKQGAELPFSDEGSLLRLVQDFYSAVWEFERRYYGISVEESEEPNLRPSGPPSFEEWLRRDKGIDPDTLSRKKSRPFKAEYNRTFDLFETDETGAKRETSVGERQGSGVRDGREMRLQEVRKFYSGAAPGFRLGWGSGLMSATVDMRLNEENVGKVLNLISRRHHPHATSQEGPKSRKLVGEGRDPRSPMGWASLKVMG